MRRSILPTTRWPLSSLAETGYSAQRSLPGHVEEIHENRALSETRRASASKESAEACRERKSAMARSLSRIPGFEQAQAIMAWYIEPSSFGSPPLTRIWLLQ